MRASTRKRIEILEAASQAAASAAAAPMIVMDLADRGYSNDPIFVELDGHRWTQEPGETRDAFKERVMAAAAKLPRTHGKNHVHKLVLQRPRLTLEKWRAKHGIAPPPDDLLAELDGAAG